MTFYRTILFALLFALAPLSSNAQTGFLFGMLVGQQLSNGASMNGGGTAVLYTAPDEVLKTADPMKLRQVASQSCFAKNYKGDATQITLGELFAQLTAERDKKKTRQVLQIVRVFDPSTPQCASIWFAYIEK